MVGAQRTEAAHDTRAFPLQNPPERCEVHTLTPHSGLARLLFVGIPMCSGLPVSPVASESNLQRRYAQEHRVEVALKHKMAQQGPHSPFAA